MKGNKETESETNGAPQSAELRFCMTLIIVGAATCRQPVTGGTVPK